MFYSVIVCQNIDKTYTYQSEMPLPIGQLVEIPLKNRSCIGMVEKELIDVDSGYEIKRVCAVKPFCLGERTVRLIHQIANYTAGSIGRIASCFVNKDSIERQKSLVTINKNQHFDESAIDLNEHQALAASRIRLDGFHVSLLLGVTGSGKTMVYLKSALDVMRRGGQVLIMIPEIALNEQLTNKLMELFGEKPYIWNSSITPAKRREIWKAIYDGELKLIIGTRSAVFLPFRNLGLVIVDEEHDESYKQETAPLYNAKHVAMLVAKLNDAPVILASATVSIDDMYNIESKGYSLVELDRRFGGASMPEIILVNNDLTKSVFSDQSMEAIRSALRRGKQVLVYLNRLGYSPITFCRGCGKMYICPNCDSRLVRHGTDTYRCHYCNFCAESNGPCIYCGSKNVLNMGLGVERVEEEVAKLFPDKRLFIASSESLSTRNKIQEFIRAMSGEEIDIVIGTQVMAKGHHFANLSLCVILDLDFSISSPDIRSIEKTYQMIHQISGRAGREADKGLVIIQTSFLKENVHNSLLLHDFKNFVQNELLKRKQHGLPPYTKLVSIIISGNVEESVRRAAYALCRVRLPAGIEVLGPIPSTISKIRGRSRWRIMLKSSEPMLIQRYVKGWILSARIGRAVQVVVDVDPVSFL